MENRLENVFEKTKNAIKNWWELLVTGILLIALGIVVFFFPGESYITLAIWFGALMFVGGFAELIISLSNRSFFINRGWNIASGVMSILLGIILCCNPGISAMIVAGIMSCAISLKLKDIHKDFKNYYTDYKEVK